MMTRKILLVVAGDVALRPRCVKNPLPSSFRVVSSSPGGGLVSFVAIPIVSFGRELVSTPRIRVNEDLVGIGVGQALSIKSID